jgi:hypothetical protein
MDITKATVLILFSFSLSNAYAASAQGPAIEKCIYGKGEAEVTVTIHKAAKKWAKKTVDITHGTTFKRFGIEIEPIPGLTNSKEKGYAGASASGDKTITNINYGSDMAGSMNFDDDGVVFQTPELKCHSL